MSHQQKAGGKSPLPRLAPSPQPRASSLLAVNCHRAAGVPSRSSHRGWERAGGGQGEGNPPPSHPLIRSVSMGACHSPNYWEKSQPFSTCQSGRGAALSGKLRGISLVLLLLLFNSQGCRIYGLSLVIIRPSQIKMIDSCACLTAALGGYYGC